MKQKYRIHICYDGTDYWGWQKQPNDAPTIQGKIEKVIQTITSEEVSVVGSGRTDRGVHALNQVAHFTLNKTPKTTDFRHSLNSLLPESIHINELYFAPEDFHAQQCVLKKTYKYLILNQKDKSPLQRNFSAWIPEKLNLNHLNELSQALLGEKDFKCFQNTGTPVPHTVRTLYKAHWSINSTGFVEFQVTGSGFLKQMVRNMVGTLIELHNSSATQKDLSQILAQKDRKLSAPPAPAQGLYLVSAEYPLELDNRCRQI